MNLFTNYVIQEKTALNQSQESMCLGFIKKKEDKGGEGVKPSQL
jgi:hypothetical protein